MFVLESIAIERESHGPAVGMMCVCVSSVEVLETVGLKDLNEKQS